MKNEEVIQELKSRKLTMSMCIDIESCISANNAIDIAINSIQENSKLKDEIEQLNRIISENIDKHECYVVSKSIEVNNLKVENNQLKSELERYKKLIPKMCENCEYEYLLGYEEPCERCFLYSNWKLKCEVSND